MKPLTQLLSGLLVASVALFNSGAVWSDTQANKNQAKSSAKATQKKATLKKAKKSSHKAKPVAKAPHRAARPATALNLHLPGAATATASAAKPNPYLALAAPAAAPSPAASLALAKSLSLASVAAAAPAPAAAAPSPVTAASAAPVAVAPAAVVAQAPQKPTSTAKPAVNPYLFNSVAYSQPATPVNPTQSLGQVFGDLKLALPSLPPMDQSILPTVKKVQPTGEKPLYVLTFKCPTELVGIVPPPTKALHWLVTAGMDGINSSDLLPFNMQQVCQ